MHVTYTETPHCYEHRLFALFAHGFIRGREKKVAIMESLGLGLCIRVSHDGADYVGGVSVPLSRTQDMVWNRREEREKRWQRVGAQGHNAHSLTRPEVGSTFGTSPRLCVCAQIYIKRTAPTPFISS